MARKQWTPEEDQFLRERYDTTFTSSLAAQMGRSVPSVRGRMHILGLKVTDTRECTTYRNPARKGCIGFKVTAVQAADMEACYSVLAPALRKEMNRYRRLVVDSFRQKNGLHSRSEGPHRDLSPEEIAYLRKVSLFQNAIDKVDFRRQIER